MLENAPPPRFEQQFVCVTYSFALTLYIHDALLITYTLCTPYFMISNSNTFYS